MKLGSVIFFLVEMLTSKGGAIVSVNRQQLHALVDLVEEAGLATLYNVMIRFIPEDEATPDEIEAIEQARAEFARGECVPDSAINWD
jgi:hypothetical protein